MNTNIFLPALFFSMKYFFDIPKEITQQIIFELQFRLMECKELLAGLQ